MDGPFARSSEWLYCYPGEIQYWTVQEVGSEDMAESTVAPEVKSSWVDVASWSSSPTSPSGLGQPESFSSDRTSLVASVSIEEANTALTTSMSSTSSHLSGPHTMYPYTSSGEPYYQSSFVNPPGQVEPGRAFGANDASYRAGPQTTDLSGSVPIISSDVQQTADPVSWQTNILSHKGKISRMSTKDRNIQPGQVSASKDEAPIVCHSCQQTFSYKSSLDRHRKETCGSGSETGRFQCNPDLHFGCKRSFKRRCGLKEHYKKLNLTEEQADAKVREQYEKGMHRRPV